jgi:hypothetical protein
VYGKLGLATYDSERQHLNDAQRTYNVQELEASHNQSVVAQKQQEADLHFQARTAGLPTAQMAFAAVNREYAQGMTEADRIVGDPKREAQVRADAFAIKVAQERKLDEQSGLEYANLQTGIRAAQLNLAGDPQAVLREQFEQDQVNQRVALVNQYGEGSGQVKAFDQKSVLERQELMAKQAHDHQQMQSESARAMADIQGEAHEAQLRAAGNTDEADREQQIRTGDDKVKILREQAAAADDAAKKTLLLAQADAPEKANAQELVALDAEQKRKRDDAPSAAAEAAKQNQQYTQQQQQFRQQALQDGEQTETLPENAHAMGVANAGQYVLLGEELMHGQQHDAKDSAKLGADRTDAAGPMRQFVEQARTSGTGQILSAQQYADALGASILHGGGVGRALAMASADLKTLDGGGLMSSSLGDVGRKLSDAADKWNHIADQMRNVTILTMGR